MAEIEYGGKTFDIVEPDTGIALRLLNVIAGIMLRGGREARQALLAAVGGVGDDISGEKLSASVVDLVLGLLAGLREEDLYRLGAAALQFGNEAAGVAFLKEHGLKLSKLTLALALNFQQATGLFDDLAEAIENFTMVLQTSTSGKEKAPQSEEKGKSSRSSQENGSS